MSDSYQADIGTVISLNTGTVITGANSCAIEVKMPSGTVVSWPGVVGVDTQSVEHTIVAGDLLEIGQYLLQAQVSLGGGTWYGKTVSYLVKDAFK